MKRLSITFTVLALAACGGGDAGESPETTAAAGETTTSIASTAPSGESIPPETTAPIPSQSPDPERSGAVITVGGDTFTYAVVDDGGSCDPDFFGAFRAILTRIDENGEPVPDEAAGEGFTESVTVSVTETLDGVIGGSRWTAGQDGDEATSIDSVEIDGNRASGTATFAVGNGETAEGSFEVVCVDG